MTLDDDALGRTYRRATVRTGGARADCPESDMLARAAAGELDGSARRRVAEHLAFCSDCSEEIQLARPFPPASQRFVVWRPLLLAALLFVAVGGVFVVQRAGRGPEATPAAERGSASTEGKTVPQDGAVLSGGPSELAWTSAPPAEEYELVLYDQESRVLWRSGPGLMPRAGLPADIRGRLVPGQHYLWRVRYIQGVERLESPLFEFALGPG